RLRAVGGGADHLEVRLRVQQLPEPGTHHQMIVGDHDPDHGAASPGSRASTRKPPPAAGPARSSPSAAAARSRTPPSPNPPSGAAGGAPPLSRTSSRSPSPG